MSSFVSIVSHIRLSSLLLLFCFLFLLRFSSNIKYDGAHLFNIQSVHAITESKNRANQTRAQPTYIWTAYIGNHKNVYALADFIIKMKYNRNVEIAWEISICWFVFVHKNSDYIKLRRCIGICMYKWKCIKQRVIRTRRDQRIITFLSVSLFAIHIGVVSHVIPFKIIIFRCSV